MDLGEHLIKVSTIGLKNSLRKKGDPSRPQGISGSNLL